MSKQPLKLEHATMFLDVVVAIIIALPLLELPQKIIELAAAFKLPIEETSLLPRATSVFLLFSALIFIAFFWLEVREFIDKQNEFNQVLKSTGGTPGSGIHLGRGRFFGGIIVTMLVVAILKFAESDYFRPFLIANIIFWLLDIAGSWGLKRRYRAYSETITKIQPQDKEHHRWFIAHINTPFYYVYSLIYALLFSLLLLIDYRENRSERYRTGMALFVLIMILVGHLYFRASFFDKLVEKKRNSN